MDNLAIANEQIKDEAIKLYTLDVAFTDADNEAFRFIETDNGYYVWPLFSRPKKVKAAKIKILCKMADNFSANTDVEEFTLDSQLTYDEFMDEFYNASALSLEDHILVNHKDNKAAFARKEGVRPQQITEWVNKGFIVVDGVLCSPRRELAKN